MAGAWVWALAAAVGGCTMSGSKPTTRPADWTDQAKTDPFNYDPKTDDIPDVSGGGIGHFDRDAFKRDMDNVLNP